LFHFWTTELSPWVISDGVGKSMQALLSFDIFAWLFVIVVLRYDVPTFVLWIVSLVRPRAFSPPLWDAAWPPISVIIAGRNPGPMIERTIRSVLECGYPGVEIIYVDDCSSDDSASYGRSFERSGAVRVFASEQHNGKPASLNIGIALARGELAFILDSDAEIEYGTLHRLAAYFTDPQVGGVAGNILLRNAKVNLLTRLQEVEYALNGSIARLWRSGIGLLPILPGAASMFRLSLLRELGGYDSGLGDDTDMTIRIRKCGWRTKFALDARMWTDQPVSLLPLLAQRIRWARNMAKIRVLKHFDLINPFKYGLSNAVLAADNLAFRVILPIYATVAILVRVFFHGSSEPVIVTALYVYLVVLLLCRVLIANDIARTPPLGDMILIPLYPFYRAMLRTIEVVAIVRELLRIQPYHPYVPRRIWSAMEYRW